MSKYRIVKHNNVFRVQEKVLFWWFWVMSIADTYMEYETIGEAEEAIMEWKTWESENGTVVREIE